MSGFSKPWGFGSIVIGLAAAVGFIAAATAVPSAQAPASAVAAASAARPVTFTKDVAPILQRSCQNCHRPDQAAPMSLLTYEDARPYARSIKTKTTARLMPPWHIERNIGIQKFKDDPSLTDEEIATIAAWVDQGAPKGDMKDMPPPRTFDNDDIWHIGKPDLVVEIPQPHVVRAAGPDLWIDYIADSGLTEDRYVQAVETKPGPGARTVMHHLLTYLIQDVDPGEKLVGVDDVRGGTTETFLNEYAVGKRRRASGRHRQTDEGWGQSQIQHSLSFERQRNGRSLARRAEVLSERLQTEVSPDLAADRPCRQSTRSAGRRREPQRRLLSV